MKGVNKAAFVLLLAFVFAFCFAGCRRNGETTNDGSGQSVSSEKSDSSVENASGEKADGKSQGKANKREKNEDATGSDGVEAESDIAVNKDEEKIIRALYDTMNGDESYFTQMLMFNPEATGTVQIEGNTVKIEFDGSDELNKSYVFKLNGDYFELTYSDDDTNGLMLALDALGAPCELFEMNVRNVKGYVSGAEAFDIEQDYFTIEKGEKDERTAKIYVGGKYKLKGLKDMFINEKVLADVEPLGGENVSQSFNCGSISAIINGTKDKLTVVIAETDNATELTLKSALAIVGAYQPKGNEQFAQSFDKVKSGGVDGVYKVFADVQQGQIEDFDIELIDNCSNTVIIFG